MSLTLKFLILLTGFCFVAQVADASILSDIAGIFSNDDDDDDDSDETTEVTTDDTTTVTTDNTTDVTTDDYDDSDDELVVTIANGQVRGIQNQTIENNVTYYAFRGIPYAEPPLDDLRFAAPVEASNWTGILNASEDKSQCLQGFQPVEGSEDCLYINVYTPTLNSSANLTVMVWIYGGAFTGGNASYAKYGPDYILEENVVFVSFGYRVGIFGFLSTGDLNCPGNWGLKDQVLALQWVQNNIANFGGNPNNVTIFGESAGSASVSYLLQTNKTTGLFNAAIMQSGQSLNLWALNVRAKKTAFSVGASVGIITTRSATLISRLRKVKNETLQAASYIISTAITLENALEGIMYGPVIEPEHDGALFTNNSHELLKQGGFHQVPLLIGGNSNEAAYVGDIPTILKAYLLNYDVSTQDLAPYDISSTFLKRFEAGSMVKSHYFALLLLTTDDEKLLQFISDDQFNRPLIEDVRLTSEYTTVYFYVFSYQGTCSGVTNRNYTGVGHAEDLSYEFVSYNNCTEEDQLTRQRFVRLITNFAKYSNPTPTSEDLLQNITWPAVDYSTSGDLDYLNIDSDLSLEQNPFQDCMDFYDELYNKYGQGNYTTY